LAIYVSKRVGYIVQSQTSHKLALLNICSISLSSINQMFCAILKLQDSLTIVINVVNNGRETLISPRKRSPRNAKNKRRADCPVIIGKDYEVDISEMSPNGEGIARVKGFMVFVGNVKLGDHVKVKITHLDSVSADAEITS